MSKLPDVADRMIEDARRAHGPTDAELAHTLSALHARLDFKDQKKAPRLAAAAAAALAADVVVASSSKAATAITTTKITLKLIIAGVALGGGVTTAVLVQRATPRAAIEHSVAAPRAATQPVHPAAVATATLTPDVVEIAPAPAVAPLPSAPPAARGARSAPRRANELTLIGRALTQLRDGQPSGALALLDEHAARHPHGKFATEREGLRVLALCAAGRRDAGRRAREEFLRDAPRAPIAARVRSACEKE